MTKIFYRAKDKYDIFKKKIDNFIELHKDNIEIASFVSQLLYNFEAFEFNYGLGNSVPNFPEIALICLQIINETLAKKIIKYGKKIDILRILWERYLPKKEVKFMNSVYTKRNEIEHEGGYLAVYEIFYSIDKKDTIPTLERYYKNTVQLFINSWSDLKKVLEEELQNDN